MKDSPELVSVATCTVFRLDNHKADHKDRGNIKNVMWDLRAQHRGRCPGYGFVIDIDEVTVAIPQRWDIPRQDDFKGYRIVKDHESSLDG